MAEVKGPRAPAGLGGRGRKFWRAVTSAYELDPAEVELLVEVCRALDDCERLAAVLAEEGPMVTGSRGQARPHPAAAELRATRSVLGRHLAQLGLPGDDGRPAIPTPLQVRGRRAAAQRWGGARRGLA